MAWFILARLLFFVGVTYTAAAVQPLPWGVAGQRGLRGRAGGRRHRPRVADARRQRAPHRSAPSSGRRSACCSRTWSTARCWRPTTRAGPFFHRVIDLLFPYIGLRHRRPPRRVAGARPGWSRCSARPAPQRRHKILDTSVIIDGRVADICETGFLDGTLVVPQFVLKELQQVADSGDTMRRNRGRRGLDILQKIQKMTGVEVMVSDLDFPEVREVDLKLIELGPGAAGQDRDQRLQPEQGGAAARRRACSTSTSSRTR